MLAYGAVALVTAAVLTYLRSRDIARRQAALREGRPTSFEAFFRGTGHTYPRRWRYGWVSINLAGPTWKPRFSLFRSPIELPPDAIVDRIRPPAGLIENFRTNPGCRIVVAHVGDVTLELAILQADMPTALESLMSGAGANWNLANLGEGPDGAG